MIRKLAFAMTLAGGMGLVSSANALGLGDVSVKSSLNQPLRAEIELVSLNGLGNEEILPGLATREEFLRAGVDRVYFLSELRFDVKKNAQGKSVVVLTTNKPVREPFLNFLVEVIWPSGRLLREYALLIDPPLFAEEPAKVVAPAPVSKPKPAPRVNSKAPAAKSATRTASSAPRSSVAGSYGPTSRRDTLWEIALKARPNRSVSPQQMMLAIQDLNPNAFIDGNINKLKAGQVLRLPTLEQVKERSAAAAVNEVIAQNERAQGKKSKTISSAAKAQAPKQAPKTRQSTGDQLKLEVPEKPVIASSNTANSGDADVAGSGRGGDGAEASNNSSGELNSDALTGKVKDLEEQLATLQRLLTLKNDQLATMQAQARQSEQAQAQAQAEQGADAGASGDGVFATDEASQAGQKPLAQGEQTLAQGEQGQEPSVQGEQTVVQDGQTQEQAQAERALAGAENALAGTDGSADQGQNALAEADASKAQNAGADSQTAKTEKPEMADKAAAPTKSAAQSAPAAEQSMLDQVIGMLTNNPLYQALAAAGAALIAILLWLVFRRKDDKNEQAADELERSEPALDADQFETSAEAQGDDLVNPDFAEDVFADDVLDDQVDAFDSEDLAAASAAGGSFDQDDEPEQEDVIAEAEMYAAYGRLDQATAKLEGAIAEDPLRVDYRLKLLEFLADENDRAGFDRQFSELEATQDQDAIAQGRAIRQQMNSSISDDFDAALDSLNDGGLVETELSSTDLEDLDAAAPLAEAEGSFEINTELDVPTTSSELELELDEDDLGIDLTSDDLELDLDIDLDGEQALEGGLEAGLENLDADKDGLSGAALGLGGAALGAAALAATAGESEEADETLEDLDLELEIDGDNASELELESELDLPNELADLDGSLELEDSLELDEGLGLDEELSLDTDASALELGENLELADELSLDDDLSLDSEASALELDADLSADLMEESSEDGLGLDDALLAGGVAAGAAGAAALATDDSADSADEIDDAILEEAEEVLAGEEPVEVNDELAEEEEFDFLNGTDEASTKLDLARAYIDMGDVDGAKDILQEVVQEGSEAQQTEAQSLLASL